MRNEVFSHKMENVSEILDAQLYTEMRIVWER